MASNSRQKEYKVKKAILIAFALAALFIVALVRVNGPSQPKALATGLPPIPSGVPSYYSFGLFNADTTTLPPGVPVNFRYQSRAGGVNTGDGWAWDQPRR